MRGQKGFTDVHLLVVLAIIGVIAAVIWLNIGEYQRRRDAVTNITGPTAIYRELTSRPISSLNMTELQFVVDYAANPPRRLTEFRYSVAAMYQNQIIITKLDELLQTEVTP